MKITLKLNPLIIVRYLASVAMIGMLAIPAIAAEKEIFNVSSSPAVKEQIQKSTPDERRRFEAAISAGNKFIPYHFDGRAYEFGDSGFENEKTFWLKNIRPLINKGIGEWINYARTQVLVPSSKTELPTYWSGGGGLMSVCPKIKLISLISPVNDSNSGWKDWYPKSFSGSSFVLEYQAKIIGVLSSRNHVFTDFFLPSENDEYETVLVSMNENYKVDHIASHYSDATFSSERQIWTLAQQLSGKWAVAITADDKARLNQIIQQIKSQKARVCKDVSSISNQPNVKE